MQSLCIIEINNRDFEKYTFSGSDLLEESRWIKVGDMETKQTKWEELSISNDFLFGKVMQNSKLCKELLQRILPDLNIERIEYPELQQRKTENGGMSMTGHSIYKCSALFNRII